MANNIFERQCSIACAKRDLNVEERGDLWPGAPLLTDLGRSGSAWFVSGRGLSRATKGGCVSARQESGVVSRHGLRQTPMGCPWLLSPRGCLASAHERDSRFPFRHPVASPSVAQGSSAFLAWLKKLQIPPLGTILRGANDSARGRNDKSQGGVTAALEALRHPKIECPSTALRRERMGMPLTVARIPPCRKERDKGGATP